MKKVPRFQFTEAHEMTADGTVKFVCSSNRDHWPWLGLDPFDPIVVQSINYWASIETGIARGLLDPAKWSALTRMDWTCGNQGAGRPVTGISEQSGASDEPGYRLKLFDAKDAVVLEINGTGVMFNTRDFETWRMKAKKKIGALATPDTFSYADAAAVGVMQQHECFLSELNPDKIPCAQALITQDNGFPPAHPYHSGSGDHVNSTHLADAARQFVHQLQGGPQTDISGGEMTFVRYVELGYPFDIKLDPETGSTTSFAMQISQADQLCAKVTLRLRSD